MVDVPQLGRTAPECEPQADHWWGARGVLPVSDPDSQRSCRSRFFCGGGHTQVVSTDLFLPVCSRCIPSLDEPRVQRLPAPCPQDTPVHCMAAIPPQVSASGSLEVRGSQLVLLLQVCELARVWCPSVVLPAPCLASLYHTLPVLTGSGSGGEHPAGCGRQRRALPTTSLA